MARKPLVVKAKRLKIYTCDPLPSLSTIDFPIGVAISLLTRDLKKYCMNKNPTHLKNLHDTETIDSRQFFTSGITLQYCHQQNEVVVTYVAQHQHPSNIRNHR